MGSTNDTYTTKKIIKNNQDEVFVAGTFGATWPGFYMDFVFKTNSCGIVDSSFGIEGMASANLFNCEDIAIQNDNKIIVSGN